MKRKMAKDRKKMDAKDRVLSKFTTGRTKSLKKRKKTLLMEYKLMNKSNKFVDRRIGEKNYNMTADDRVMARFVAQRMKSHSKKQMFNLESDEVLTHHGRTLEDVEKFDNVRSDSDDDEDGNLDAAFVEKAHFGGGLFSKASESGNSHQSTIDQLIAESKRRKFERQMIKEETQNLTDKLDKDLKELLPVVHKQNENVEETVKIKPDKTSYDVLVRELKFEPVGRPSNKIKPEDQIEVEEREKLAKLEKERLERMKRVQVFEVDEHEKEPATKKHISADDLDDGLDLDAFREDDEEGEGERYSEESSDEAENTDGKDETGCENYEDKIDVDDENEDESKVLNKRNVVVKTKKPSIVPENLADLLRELSEKDTSEKVEVIKNLIRLQKIHTGVSVKENMINFFKVLIEYIDSIFTSSSDKDSWSLVNQLSPVLFELIQIAGDDIVSFMIASLKERHDCYSVQSKSNVRTDTLIFLKLIPLLFPTSDYYHPITTPAAVFISQILSENSCKTLKCIAKGLFLTTVMLEFIHLSKRYCPETLNFLRNVLYIAIPNFEDAYPPVHTKNKILVLESDHAKNEIPDDRLKLSFSLITDEVPENDESRILILYTTLRILDAYCQHYDNYSAAKAIWLPIMNLVNRLPVEKYPQCISSKVEDLKSKIKMISERPLQYILAQTKRPKALRLYEPNIRPVVDGRSFRTVSQTKLEKDKLMRQYKREKKGAFREIRKDQKLLTRVSLSEQAKRDAERKDKVKQIFGWGQSQQSELKRMQRKNRFRR